MKNTYLMWQYYVVLNKCHTFFVAKFDILASWMWHLSLLFLIFHSSKLSFARLKSNLKVHNQPFQHVHKNYFILNIQQSFWIDSTPSKTVTKTIHRRLTGANCKSQKTSLIMAVFLWLTNEETFPDIVGLYESPDGNKSYNNDRY